MNKKFGLTLDDNGIIRFNENSTSKVGNVATFNNVTVPTAGVTLTFPSGENIAGCYINSNERVKITGIVKNASTLLGIGSLIFNDDVDTQSIKIEPVDVTADYGEITSSSTGSSKTTLVVKDNYKYSKRIGSKVTGGIYSLLDAEFVLQYHGDSYLIITIDSYSNNPADGLDSVANSLCSVFNAKVLSEFGNQAVTLSWDTTLQHFVLTAGEEGPITLSISGDYAVNIGMHDSILYTGTEDYASCEIEFLDGTNVGVRKTLSKAEGNTLEIGEAISNMDSTRYKIVKAAADPVCFVGLFGAIYT